MTDGTAKLVDWDEARERIAARLKARREVALLAEAEAELGAAAVGTTNSERGWVMSVPVAELDPFVRWKSDGQPAVSIDLTA